MAKDERAANENGVVGRKNCVGVSLPSAQHARAPAFPRPRPRKERFVADSGGMTPRMNVNVARSPAAIATAGRCRRWTPARQCSLLHRRRHDPQRDHRRDGRLPSEAVHPSWVCQEGAGGAGREGVIRGNFGPVNTVFYPRRVMPARPEAPPTRLLAASRGSSSDALKLSSRTLHA